MGGYTIRVLVLSFQKHQGELRRGKFLEYLNVWGMKL